MSGAGIIIPGICYLPIFHRQETQATIKFDLQGNPVAKRPLTNTQVEKGPWEHVFGSQLPLPPQSDYKESKPMSLNKKNILD